jgi:tetratricopeptide (TPR) repeat protein
MAFSMEVRMASPQLLAHTMRLLVSGAWLQSEAAARAAMADDPNDPHAVLLLALAIASMGEVARAAPIMTELAASHPEAHHPCIEFARLNPPLPRSLVADQFHACLRLTPSDDRLRLGCAEFLLDTGQPAEAETILADGPDTAACHHLKGLIQAELNQLPAAIASFERAILLDPNAAASWSNLGMILKVEGRHDEAIAAHDRAIVLYPGNPRFRVNRAVALLMAGVWDRAWQDYEARLDLSHAAAIDRTRLMPSLRPGDNLQGMTILALHEDGFGDTVQFLRYLPLLAEHGAKVIACVPPSLARVMRAVPGVTEVVTNSRCLPPHDFVCPMFSLPRVFGTTIATIPPVPILVPDAELLRHWAGRLPSEGLRVGLVWAGQPRPLLPGFATVDARRSAGLAAFAPLFDLPGLTFVSLQAGMAARQVRPHGITLIDPMPYIDDFADTAAIIAGLDVVVSVDTSVVHLAGLVGKPVFMLDRYDGCWRWLSGRSDSPWYPALTIFRQAQPGDWAEVMSRVAAALEAMAMFHGMGSPSTAKREHAFVA